MEAHMCGRRLLSGQIIPVTAKCKNTNRKVSIGCGHISFEKYQINNSIVGMIGHAPTLSLAQRRADTAP
jgi:hypothetical protein